MENNPTYAKQAWYNTNFDQGNVFAKGKGSGNLSYAAARSGVVNVGGYAALSDEPAQVKRGFSGFEDPGAMLAHMPPSAGGGTTHSMLRFRRSGVDNRSTGWRGLLTQSSGSNKAFMLGGAGRGQSSEDTTKDTTKERYSTIETRMGTRAQFTNEVWDEAKASFGRTWVGFKELSGAGGTPFLNANSSQMFIRTNQNVGFARRANTIL